MNLRPGYLVAPGHAGSGHNLDIYVEVAGPATSDVHHNFVQRWNEASERAAGDGTWGHTGDDDLSFPVRLSSARGASPAQIQRTIHAGRYRNSHPAVGAAAFGVAGGEHTILQQYLQAIDAARRSIYIENQAIPIQPVAMRLDAALSRGVEVVLLVPGQPEESVRAARRNPDRAAHFAQVAALGHHEGFTLAGIAGLDAHGARADVYVHAKAMLIDDVWATIGSCNLHSSSLTANSELNVSFHDPAAVRALRVELLAEHLDCDTTSLDDRTALQLIHRIARDNRRRREAGDARWQGLAFALDPAAYGT
jgi:phosphatidylserine/phosphatidylglycerophosphate/cardiolipin synthase-like enzyme